MNYDDSISILTSALQREQFPVGEWYEYNGTPHPLVKALPYYGIVPKDPVAQLRWRAYVRQRCAIDLEFRAAIDHACRHDILFHFNTLFWIFEPRPVGRKLPFNTWSDQDSYICRVYDCFGRRDAAVEKSRGIGFSYMGVAIFYHDWDAVDESKLGLVSRKKDSVESAEDSDALMWKLDYIHNAMPFWRRFLSDGTPSLDRAMFRFVNRRNGSAIFGYEATGNVTTGGRKRAMLLDEFAKFPQSGQEALNSTQHVTNCRLVISTYFRGMSTRFYSMMRREESTVLKLRAHWLQNPDRTRGLYTFENGNLVILDKSYPFPADYHYVNAEHRHEGIVGGKMRSPWYDFECARTGATNESIAEELDIDPQTATAKLFKTIAIEKAMGTATPPLQVGVLDFNTNDFKPVWLPCEDGTMKIWAPLTAQNKIGHPGPFVLGADISHGTGTATSSNSTIEVCDHNTGEQLIEFASNTIQPITLAQLMYVLAMWLSDDRGQSWVYINWESNFAGDAVFKELTRLGWANFYHQETQLSQTGAKGRRPGYRNRDKGLAVLLELQRAIVQGSCTIRSKDLAEELLQYELRDDQPFHAGAAFDAGGKRGLAHGDRVMGMAVCWLARQDRTTSTPLAGTRPVPYGSLAWRVLEASKKPVEMGTDGWWSELDGESADDDGMADLLKMLRLEMQDSRHEPSYPGASRQAV